MNSIHKVNSFTKHLKRDAERDEKKRNCKLFKIAAKGAETLGNVATDIVSIAGINQKSATGSAIFGAVSHFFSGGADMAFIANDCESIPFEEIKEILNVKFNEMDRKLDRNYDIMQPVSDIANKTLSTAEAMRVEMKEGFNQIMMSIKNSRVEPLISKIKNFVQYFEREKTMLEKLQKDDYVSKLEEANNVLLYLKDSSTPKDDSLQSLLHQIVDQNYALPADENDRVAFSALYALFYGTQTYLSVLKFLLDKYSYLAGYHYQNSDLEEYNMYVDAIKIRFRDFQTTLVEISNRDRYSLIDRIIEVLVTVQNKYFIESGIFADLTHKIDSLKVLKKQLKEMVLPIVIDTPKDNVSVRFKGSQISTQISVWKEARTVSYAVQYKKDNTYSKISSWSKPVPIRGKSNPTLKIPVDLQGRTRLIFRKLGKNKPQLIGILDNSHQTELRDINRDLYYSAQSFNKEQAVGDVKILLSFEADANAIFEKGRTALHAAAQSNNKELALILLEKTKVDIKDQSGYTPLHIAAELGHTDFVSFLIDNGADVNAKTNEEALTPLHLAVHSGFETTVKILVECYRIKINEGDNLGFTPLHYAVTSGQPVLAALLSSGSIDINVKSKSGLSALHLATIDNNTEAVNSLLHSFILTKPIDVNAKDKKGLTPLHMASSAGSLEIVKLLTAFNEIDLNASSFTNQWTALHSAIFFKRENVALLLSKMAKTNVDATAEDDITPLHLAVVTGQKNIVLALLPKANAFAETKQKFTALHFAAMRDNEDVFYTLLTRGLNFTAQTINNETPLHFAAGSGNKGIVSILLVREVDDMSLDKNNEAPIHKAARNGNIETLKALVEHNAGVIYMKNNRLETPLIIAAKEDNSNIIQYFCNIGIKVDHQDIDGNTALHFTAKNNNFMMVNSLLNARADLNIQNNDKETPLDVARKYNADGVLSYLESRSSRRIRYVSLDSKQSEMSNGGYGALQRPLVNGFSHQNGHTDKAEIGKFKLSNTFSRMTRASTYQQPIDFIGTFLLLDIFIRKCTGRPYVNPQDPSAALLDAKALALSMTEEFEKFLNCLGNMSAEELIDLTEVYSEISKALISGKSEKLPEILCSYLNEFSKLDTEENKKLIAMLLSKSQNIFTTIEDEKNKNLPYKMSEICFMNP